ncbi:MAG: GGDEF domain-containing protein [Pseudomonadales bacterium]|nr:GGDEF domain-containing protein [Pseudomonadales bacterium]NRA16568.1 GGDEF domain-containing protein [Oceanospirillaceae bacterium]
MVDMRPVTLICAMMVMSLLFAYSSFYYSLVLSLLLACLYLLIGFVGGYYFDHPWNVSVDFINAFAFFLSSILIGYMIHRSTVLLRRQAYNDFLTRLLNRRAISHIIETEFQRSLRFNTPATLVMMDLDDFKVINDRFGHAGGDAVLVHVAKGLQQHLRGTDHLARWGGEEFLALLIGVSPLQAKSVIERALANLNARPLNYNESSIPVSFSAGISSLNDFASAEAAIQDADRMLYIAKAAGKSRVMYAVEESLAAKLA